MKVVLKILAIIIWVILSVLGIAVKTTEKIGNIVAGFVYVILMVFALMAVISQQWVSLGIFGVCAAIVFGLQFTAATIEALLEVGKDLCKL